MLYTPHTQRCGVSIHFSSSLNQVSNKLDIVKESLGTKMMLWHRDELNPGMSYGHDTGEEDRVPDLRKQVELVPAATPAAGQSRT